MTKQTFALLTITLLIAACMDASLIPPIGTDNQANATSGVLTTGLGDVSSFDAYVDNNTIHLLVAGKASAQDKENALRYLSSNDGGYHWNKPAVITDNLPKTIATRGNDVQLAAHGSDVVALWQTKGELPSMGPLVTAYSHDGGLTWQYGMNPAVNNQGDQSHADLLADQQGNFHTVWLEDPEENGYQSLRYASSADAGKTWNKVVTLDDSTCSCCWNTLALSPNSSINILYRDMKPRDMALMQSGNQGKSWQRASTVGEFGWQFDGCPHTGGALVSAGGNSSDLYSLVWTGLEAQSGLYYLHSADNGKTWTAPKTMGEHAVHSDIAALDTNHLAAVWDELGSEGSSIVSSQSLDGGNTWDKTIRLTNTTINASHPRILVTTKGFITLWTEKAAKQPVRLAWKIIYQTPFSVNVD